MKFCVPVHVHMHCYGSGSHFNKGCCSASKSIQASNAPIHLELQPSLLGRKRLRRWLGFFLLLKKTPNQTQNQKNLLNSEYEM